MSYPYSLCQADPWEVLQEAKKRGFPDPLESDFFRKKTEWLTRPENRDFRQSGVAELLEGKCWQIQWQHGKEREQLVQVLVAAQAS